MDSKFQLLGFSSGPRSLNAFHIQSKCQSKFNLCTDARCATPHLKTTGTSGPCDLNTQGIKRKWSDACGSEELEDGFSPRQSPSSSDSSSASFTSVSSLSSAKETDEESSMDIELNFHLNLGGNDAPLKPSNDVLEVGMVVEPGKLADPKLSLSTRSSSSAITTTSPFSVHRAELSIGPPSNALQVASVDSAEVKPVLADAPTSSSVTSVSEFKRIQHEWITDAEHLHRCETRVRNVSCHCSSHDDYWMSKRDDCQQIAEGGTVCYKLHDTGYKEIMGCMDGLGGHGEHKQYKEGACTYNSRSVGSYLNFSDKKMSQMEERSTVAEGYCSLCSLDGRGRRCSFPNCSKYALPSTYFCKARHCGLGGCCAVPNCTKRARGGTSFCIPHGGGKQCQEKGCAKSARRGIDFCKNHIRSKKCPWGHPGSNVGKGEPPCDRYAREKTGLCATHRVLVQDQRVHGGRTVTAVGVPEPYFPTIEGANFHKAGEHNFINIGIRANFQSGLNNPNVLDKCCVNDVTEGRVHGGGLMAILKSRSEARGTKCNHAATGPSGWGVPPLMLLDK